MVAFPLCLAILVLLAGCGRTSTESRTASGADARAARASRPIDGGANYFKRLYLGSGWADRHILLGAWEEQPQNLTDVRDDVAMGNNTYFNLGGTPGIDRVDYNVIREGGMHAFAPERTSHSGSETIGYEGIDESDMDYGPGTRGWDSKSTTYNQSACIPSGSKCGYSVSNFFYRGDESGIRPPGKKPPYPIDGHPIHQETGKGTLFWEPDAEAARFMTYADVNDSDAYWMTDRDLLQPTQGGCALLPRNPIRCGRGIGSGLTLAQGAVPANYQYNIKRLEQLNAENGTSKPIMGTVEVGCPFTGARRNICTTVPQFQAAAWQSLIAGARGIIWFQHSFSGPCEDLNTFYDGSNPSNSMYDCHITPGETLHDIVQGVTSFNREVESLTGVLFSPSAIGAVRTVGDVSVLAKTYRRGCYVFAGSGKPASPPPANQSVIFKLANGYSGLVTVYDEHRTVEATNGTFRDVFADADTVHIYRIQASLGCGPRT